jgi:hypothetical protein
MSYKEFERMTNNGEKIVLSLRTFVYAVIFSFNVWRKTPRSDRPCPRP